MLKAAARRVLSIGECMVEFSSLATGNYRRSFAGDTFNTAWYLRKLLNPDWSVQYFTCIGDDRQSQDMLAFMEDSQIDTAHVTALPGEACGLYTISLDAGERGFSYWRQTAAVRHLADEPEAL